MEKIVVSYNSKESDLPRTIILIEKDEEQELLWSSKNKVDVEVDNSNDK